MPRARSRENSGLPKRWQIHHGAYYYRVPAGLEHLWDGKRRFLLGKSLPEAYKVWSERIQEVGEARTIAGLLERYALEVVPAKAPTTQDANLRAIQRLARAFGRLPVDAMRPKFVYGYVDRRSARIAAHREVEVLSHAYTKAVEWGLIDRHPFKGQVRLEGESARDRYVQDREVLAALALESRRKRGSVMAVQAYIRVKLLTALRRGDLLRLRMTDLEHADGIHIQPRKTAKTSRKRIIIEWTPELRAAVDLAKEARPIDIGPYLFCNRRGECYVDERGKANGWDSMWQRFMARVMAETDVTERFTEHDLRAKCGSDADSLEHARQLLAHADARLTQRVYRRKPELVRPGKGV